MSSYEEAQKERFNQQRHGSVAARRETLSLKSQNAPRKPKHDKPASKGSKLTGHTAALEKFKQDQTLVTFAFSDGDHLKARVIDYDNFSICVRESEFNRIAWVYKHALTSFFEAK